MMYNVLTRFYLVQFTCGHFKKCNEWLAERYGEEGRIDWSLTPNKSVLSPTAATAEKDMSVSANGQKGQSSSGTDKTNGQAASTNADKNDPVSDEEDLDAIEALVAAEESLKSKNDDSLDKPKETESESEKK